MLAKLIVIVAIAGTLALVVQTALLPLAAVGVVMARSAK